MYSVEKIKAEFEEYRLIDSSTDSSATVSPSRGGILISFVCNGRERLYLDRKTYLDTNEKVSGGNPVLFPSCSKLKNGEYTWAGNTYAMGAHGIARDFPWKMTSTDTSDAASVTVCFESSEETRKIYPFDFKAEFTYSLKGNTLTVTQKITNTSDVKMPFVCGLHPYFLADTAKAKVNVPSKRASYNGNEVFFDEVLYTTDDLDHVCMDITGDSAVLETGLGYTVRVNYKGAYTCVVVWSPDRFKEFVCIEPWTAAPNALNTGKDLIILEPGEETVLINEFVIEE